VGAHCYVSTTANSQLNDLMDTEHSIQDLRFFFVKAVFKEDELAYQIGETTEILSKGHLCATPHCVQVLFNKHFSYKWNI
jgi:hypothetical protein